MSTTQDNAPESETAHAPDRHPDEIDPAHTWMKDHDADLYEVVERERRPLLVLGSSAQSSVRGCTSAAEDAMRAVDALARVTGLDVRAWAERPETVTEWASSMSTVYRSGTIAPTVGLRAAGHGLPGGAVHVVLLAGASDVRAEFLSERIKDAGTPFAGVFATRADRMSRSLASMSMLMRELATIEGHHGGWSGDGYMGRWDFPSGWGLGGAAGQDVEKGGAW